MRFIIENIMTTAVIGGKDNLLDIDLTDKLRKYLRVRPDGYEKADKYKEGKWDGYKYFVTSKNKFSTGFFPLVAKYMESLGADIVIEDKRGTLPQLFEESKMDDYIGEINGETWHGRPMQFDLIKTVNNYIEVGGQSLYFPRGILDAATNAGKNSMAALITNNLKEKYTTIFMVSGITIFKQAVEFFSQVIGEPVGQIKSGKYAPKWFTVCMVRTLYNKANKDINVRTWLNTVEVLYVDESDESGAAEYAKTLSYINAGMRIFVSGTPLESSKVNNMLSIGLSGQVLGTITNKQLIDAGYSQKPTVHFLLNHTVCVPINYDREKFKAIHTSVTRVKLIENVIREHSSKNIVISFTEKVHGYFMFNYLRNALPDIDMDIVHGESKDREAIIDSYKTGKITVLFSSMILKRGANIPNINVLVMAQGGKSTITVKQYSGRGLRHDGESNEMLIFDFYDIGKWISDHSRKRRRIYKKEEFEIIEHYPTHRGIAQLR